MKTKKQNIQRSSIYTIIFLLLIVPASYSCTNYLDAKPDRSLAEPVTTADFQAILDTKNVSTLYPFAGDIGSDNYYLPYTTWAGLSNVEYRNTYVWDPKAANDQDWQFMYQSILNSNIIINGVKKIVANKNNREDINQVKGSACFFRGYCYFQLANVFTLPYSKTIGGQKASGLPLHLDADITTPTVRSTLDETYQQIISDLKTAANLLPAHPLVKTRPSKPAAYGALARTYLVMGNFKQAALYADSCLQLANTLIDYNTLNPSSNLPFPIFNDEVVFHNTTSGRGGVLLPSKAVVDSVLYASYTGNDLRKVLFFKLNAKHLPVFKGDYGGSGGSNLFGGLATDEMYLIRAESNCRLDHVAAAVTDLNSLLANRYASGTFIPYSGSLAPADALSLIIQERRKELAFRSELRWSDLRRFSIESTFAKTLTRNLNGIEYMLPAGDKRYAYLIPVSVVIITGIPQNAR